MTCAKVHVAAELTGRSGKKYIAFNNCDNPQETCPRAPGEGYAKCVSICQQKHHAEVGALMLAGDDARGGHMRITYTHACDACKVAMDAAGVTSMEFQP